MNDPTLKLDAVSLPPAADDSREQSRRGYQLFAPLYDLIFGLSLHHGRRVAIAALDCRPGERILDACVGSGLSLSMYPPGVQVTGVDYSDEMLAKAARRVQRQPPGTTEALMQMDVQRMPFADASFDKAVVLFAMSGLPDPVRAIHEIERVCKPGATIVIANHFLSRRPLQRFFDVLLWPIYRLLRYRADLDLDAFVAAAGLDVLASRPANLFGYSTVLTCRRRERRRG